MILDLDCGNSSLRWRIINAAHKMVAQGRAQEIEQLLQAVGSYAGFIVHARLSLVASWQARAEWLVSLLENELECKVRVAVSAANQQGLISGYEQPEKLGVDRWLAMLAAWVAYGDAFMLIDAGTAITVDHVAASGVHRGGVIAPGLGSLMTSLGRNAALPNAEFIAGMKLGKGTEHCIGAGVTAMFSSFLYAQHELAGRLQSSATPRILVTGGDASWVLEYLKGAEHKADLVLDGLALALPLESDW